MNRVSKSPVINRFSRSKKLNSPRPGNIPGLTPTAPQFGSGGLTRSTTALSGSHNGASFGWRQSIPLIAVLSSVGLFFLAKLNGGFSNFQWRNPFATNRQDEPKQPSKPEQEPQAAKPTEGQADEVPQAAPVQEPSEPITKPAEAEPALAADATKPLPQIKTPHEERELEDSGTLPPLTHTALLSLLASPSIQAMMRSPQDVTPSSPRSMSSFEVVDEEDGVDDIISLPNTPFVEESPARSPVMTSPVLKAAPNRKRLTVPASKL